ncbi:25559_t:CDS:2, partial [Gigaspora margarita]
TGPTGTQSSQTDRKKAKEWQDKRSRRQDDDKVLKRTKTIDRAENIDDSEADSDYNKDNYSNCDIDPNIELSEEQIPVQNHLKYPG